MTEPELQQRLAHAITQRDPTREFSQLTADLVDAGADVKSVSVLLKFVESHPAIDFGTPGPLVHFVEKFFGKGYEAALLESVVRKPTDHTAWMLNRVLNGIKVDKDRAPFLAAMRAILKHPAADDATRQAATRFLKRT